MRIFILILTLLAVISCKKVDTVQSEYPCELDMERYDFSFGIEYDNPQKYLIPSDQSDVSSEYLEEIRELIGTPEMDLDGIKLVSDWFNKEFTFTSAGGANIGKFTINHHYETKTIYGCHSAALVISSVLRAFGFPTVMIETASILWAKEYFDGTNQGFAGHVMTEVYVNNNWILLDNNGTYIKDYYESNPYINTMTTDFHYNEEGLFVIAKGVDIWDYGVHDHDDTRELMINFSDNLGCFEHLFGSMEYSWLRLE